jgi:hypothetical protein
MIQAIRGLTVTHTMLQALIVAAVTALAVTGKIAGDTAVGVLVALAGIGGGQVQAAMAHTQAARAKAVAENTTADLDTAA